MKSLLSIIFGVAFAGVLVAYGVRDEVRLGKLTGRVTMMENGKALPGATVMLRRSVDPSAGYMHIKSIKTGEGGQFNFGQLPTGSYTIEAYAKAHSVDESVFSVREGDTTNLDLDAKPGSPYLRAFSPKHVFLPKSQPELTVEGFGQDKNLEVTLFKVDLNKVVAAGGLQSILSSAWKWDEGLRTEDPAVFKTIKSKEIPIERRDVEGAYVETVKLETLPSGMYWVSTRAGRSLRSGSYFIVSEIALVTKRSGRELSTFATHMDTGKALANTQITVYQGSKTVANGKTDSSGFSNLSIPRSDSSDLTVVAKLGNEAAVVPLYIYDSENTSLQCSIFTDRPIYRPGHKVEFKGVLRNLDGARYSIPTRIPINIEIQDADAVVVKRLQTQSDDYGGFSGNFMINSQAETGGFTIQATAQGRTFSETVEVASYRKPDFEIKVQADKPYFVRGDRVTGEVEVDYYFGGAVPEAEVHGLVFRRPFYGEYEEYFSDYEGGDSGEYLGEFKAITNGEGIAKFSYDTSSLRDPESDYVYTFEVSVSDQTGRTFDGKGSVKVTRGEFDLTAFTTDYVIPQGEQAMVEVDVKDFNGRPLDGIDIDVQYGIETWSENTSSIKRLGRVSATSKGGKASISAVASEPGYFVFEVRARDRRGNVILSRPGVYVPGQGDFEFGGSTASLSVKLDKHKYKLSEVAQAIILSPNAADAWLTVEGNGIYFSRKVALKSGGNLVDIKIDERMLPNAFVTVQYVFDTKYYESSAELFVNSESREMDVTVTPDRSAYEPGDLATFTIQTKDRLSGKPIVADMAFSLVDESIYAIRADSVDLLDDFYPMRYSRVDTNYSFPEIYLGDGDKDNVEFDVRKRFLDTADWQPSVVTDASGIAKVTVTLPDNLTTWRATARGLSVQSSLAGQGIAKVRSAKPLMVRLGLPRFMVAGDEIEITASVNSAKDAMDVTVSLSVDGAEILDSPRRSLRVDPSSPATERFRIRATKAGNAQFEVRAISGAPNVTDAMQSSIPVLGLGRLAEGYQVGQTASSKNLQMNLAGYVPGSGNLQVRVASSLEGTIGGSLDYLVGYPYGCVEQTLNRFAPTLIVSKSRLAANLSPEVRAQLPDMIAKGYARLRAMQHSDGGWGWWEADEADPRMTGLVLEGYALAKTAGTLPDQDSLNRAADWARNWLTSDVASTYQLSDKLQLIRGLSAHGQSDAIGKALSELKLKDATSEDWANVAIAAHRAGDAALAKQAIAKLRSAAAVNANHAHWSGEWYGSWTTAQALLALATVAPDDPLISKGVRYLFDTRRGSAWYSTADTAAAILAISKITDGNPSGGAKGVRVEVNGSPLATGAVPKSGELVLDIPMDSLNGKSPSIVAEGGEAYYTATWRYRADDERVKSGSQGDGLGITREYYRMKPRRLETGELRLLPGGNPVTSVEAGEIVRAVVKINSNRLREYMMLEDPIPAGFEVLERSSDGIESWEWFFWYTGLDIRDDRIVFFLRRLKPGESVIEYTLRAESPGKRTSLPAVLSNMYDPDDASWTGSRRIEVTR